MMMTRLLRLSLLGVAALLMLAAPTAVWATDHKPAACADHTPHKVRFVKVAPGVELEVLDWGGKGKAMVLLAGGGDNAHVYDQFAYQFTDYFHVIGITRRGYLPSSQPRNGYDIPTRAADDIAVLDALGIDKAVFVGHSARGHGTEQAGTGPQGSCRQAGLPGCFRPVRALFAVAPRAAAARLYRCRPEVAVGVPSRHRAVPGTSHPDSGVVPRSDVLRGGSDLGFHDPDWVSKKISTAVNASSPTNWASIKAPRLGIFALFTLEARQAWYWYLSPAKKAEFDAAWGPIVDWHRTTIAKFEQGNSANTFLLPGAPHYVYITNEAEVVRWMRKFLGIPPRG